MAAIFVCGGIGISHEKRSVMALQWRNQAKNVASAYNGIMAVMWRHVAYGESVKHQRQRKYHLALFILRKLIASGNGVT